MIRIGLTGGIGSGKSTVAQIWVSQFDSQLMDADAVSKALTAPHGAAVAAIVKEFGQASIAADQGMNRAYMRALAFSDADARKRLEAILHPLIRQAIQQQMEHAQAQNVKSILLDIPLLIHDSYWRSQIDHLLVVDCPEDKRIARVQKRSDISAEAIRAIIANQPTREQLLSSADYVIDNSNSENDFAELKRQISSIGRRILLS